MLNQVTTKTEKQIREIIVEYVERVGYKKATDESLYILGKLGHTSPTFINLRAGRLLPVVRFRAMVLEYLYGDDDTMEKELIHAAKKYLRDSKRIAYKGSRD